MIDAAVLREAEHTYRTAALRAEAARDKRNRAVWLALDSGWTHAAIAEATGLTRGRINQIARQERAMDNIHPPQEG